MLLAPVHWPPSFCIKKGERKKLLLPNAELTLTSAKPGICKNVEYFSSSFCRSLPYHQPIHLKFGLFVLQLQGKCRFCYQKLVICKWIPWISVSFSSFLSAKSFQSHWQANGADLALYLLNNVGINSIKACSLTDFVQSRNAMRSWLYQWHYAHSMKQHVSFAECYNNLKAMMGK